MNAPSSVRDAPAPPEFERERLGSIALDQWRGLALALVLVSHGFYLTDRVHGVGRVGVNLFFFISGILVFRSLSRSRAAGAWERSRSFWWRRFRRLYPAMITYTLAMLGGTWLLRDTYNVLPRSDVGSYVKAMPLAFGYVMNYTTDHAPMALGHLWSLACEMQFYLLGPLIFLAGGKAARRRNSVFGGLVLLLMGMGVAHPIISRWRPNTWQYNFEFAVWPMMLGFWCEYKRDWFRRLPEKLVGLALWGSTIVCGVVLALTLFGMEMKLAVVATGALLLPPCVLAYLRGRPVPGVAGQALKWLGERTYSIYLWQQPFTICRFLPAVLHPMGAAASIAVGALWFRLFERPFLTASRREDEAAVSAKNGRGLRWLAAGAAALVLGGLLTTGTMWTRYETRLRQQLRPAGAPQAPVLVGGPAGAPETVLLLGDSRMAQWALPDLGPCRVVNAGAGGLTTGQVRLRAAAALAEFHPDTVVVQAGINDLKYLGLRPELAEAVIGLARSNLTALVEDCAARRCRVIVLETWPAGRPSLLRRAVWSPEIAASVDRLNRELRKRDAPEKGIRVVDLFRRAGISATPEQYTDTLHFKPEVYERLTGPLREELRLSREGRRKNEE